MTALRYNQSYMELFGFCPKEDGNNRTNLLTIRVFTFGTILILGLIPSLCYIYFNSDDTEILISTLCPATCHILVLISYWTFCIEGDRAKKTFIGLRALVTERTKAGITSLYEDAENQSFIVTKWPVRITCFNFAVISIILALHQVLMDWLSGDVDPKHWTLVYRLSLPFDQQTYYGFLLVNIIQSIYVADYFILLTLVIAYFLSICFYVEAICVDFEQVFLKLNNSVNLIAMEVNLILASNLQIQAVNAFKQMVRVVSGTVFAQVICGTIFLSTSYFQLELTIITLDLKMLMTIFATILAVAAILPYCYYASRTTMKMQYAANIVFESRWYKLPVYLQKNFTMIIAFAQVKREVNGYGLLNCNLEGFMKIIKTSLSYYLMFKSISNR